MTVKPRKAPPATQPPLPGLSDFKYARSLTAGSLVSVPVDPTFDVGQGLREIKQGLPYGGEVAFDWRFLGLAHEYMGGEPDPHEPFVTERGGLVSLATPMNVFRVQGSITRWAHDKKIPIAFSHVPPEPETPAQRLYDVLAIEQTARSLRTNAAPEVDFRYVAEFQSRYVSPIVLVDGQSKRDVVQDVTDWTAEVQKTGDLHFDLLKLLPEVVTNIVKHGHTGSLNLSIWPLGQVELLWCNRIRPGDLIFAHAEPRDAATALSHNASGSAMSFILDDLLPKYTGTLCVNFRGADIMFHAGKRVELFHPGRRDDHFTPDSVLFTLHLFSVDARPKGM